MERRGEKGAAAGRARRPQGAAEQPSFSSTLLDAIYKSMDEPGHGAGADAAAKKKQQEEALHYSYYYRPSLAGSYRARAPGPAHATTTTSSSSDCSSYGGFSSSEAETSSSRHHRRLRPIRTAVAAAAPAPPAPEKKAKPSKKQQPAPGASIRAKLRDLRKAPASPGARLAGFLNTIFAGSGSKRAPQTPPSASTAAEYACSTASSASYSRSCLSKTPSTRGGGGQQASRTVRFVDSAAEAPATVPGRRMPARAVEQMLLRRMEMESDEEEDDEESSDASSDLFELENFTAAPPGPGGAAGYRDELPVYETTRVVLNRGLGGHGYGHGRSARVV